MSKKKKHRHEEPVAKKEPIWPRKEKLKDAFEVILEFQMMCQHQLELGYWATIDFPSKHHINKILSLQYMDQDLVDKLYGPEFAKRCKALIPVCRNFLEFTKFKDMNENVDVEQKRKDS